MRLTTLCYTENSGRWLMMHRVKKSEDENAGKWIGLGGHLQDGETPEECVRREVREEAGLELTDLRIRGVPSPPPRPYRERSVRFPSPAG